MKPSWVGLAKLCEESAEVIQVVAKLSACPSGVYYDGTNLLEWLEGELADLTAIMRFVQEQNGLHIPVKRIEEKYQKFCEWTMKEDING